jgi:hypothetical protein
LLLALALGPLPPGGFLSFLLLFRKALLYFTCSVDRSLALRRLLPLAFPFEGGLFLPLLLPLFLGLLTLLRGAAPLSIEVFETEEAAGQTAAEDGDAKDRCEEVGRYVLENCMLTCTRHNTSRGDKNIEDYLRSSITCGGVTPTPSANGTDAGPSGPLQATGAALTA